MTRKTPGVYIEEISTLPASIAPVATAIPAFIGYTALADRNGEDLKNIPTRITSMLEYEQYFGKGEKAGFDIQVQDVFDTGSLISRSFSATVTTPPTHILYYAMQLYFSNGGGPCYIVSVGSYSDEVKKEDLKSGLDATEKVDEPTLYVFPDAVSITDADDRAAVTVAALTLCAKLQDRFTISDVVNDQEFRDKIGLANLKYGAAYYPFLKTTLNYAFENSTINITQSEVNLAGTASTPVTNLLPSVDDIETGHPSIYRSILAELKKMYVTLPPSPAIAGVYARVDAERGVWKAPANVGLRSVIAPEIRLTNADQENLNVDVTAGKSINAIRSFAGKGILVWGARTLAGNDNEWRYVPVRRFYIFVEESVKKATEFVVFEPNDAKTWVRVKAMIENFLTGLWREGALAGASPKEAFFVHVGLGQTMTSDDILNGIMNIEIGMAAVRPAEFIILKFSHKLQES